MATAIEREQQIQQLKTRRDQIKAKIDLLEAKKSTAQRKEETRKKILAGSLLLLEEDPTSHVVKGQTLRDFLTRDADRALFGLPPLPSTEEEMIG